MSTPYFNEIIGPSGQIRDHYKGVYARWGSLKPKQQRTLHELSVGFFSGDYALDPLPRILTQSESELLRKAVNQRARAILAFLNDYCGSGTLWNRIISESTLNTIVLRHHPKNSLRDLKPNSLAFQYGPDVIRNRSGHWKVIEDSSGVLGGMGDLLHSRRILFRLMPEYRGELVDSNDPLDFFKELANHFKQKAAKNGGIPFLYLQSFKLESDKETQRLARVFSSLGIQSATFSDRSKKLVIEGKGAKGNIFLRSGTTRHRIGALIVHSPPERLDDILFIDVGKVIHPKHEPCFMKISRSGKPWSNSPSLTDALIKGYTWTNFSPGIQFVNDKMFGLFVDTMIMRLLKETPIITSIPAFTCAVKLRNGLSSIDRNAIQRLRRNKDRYVIKKVNEDGGSGVWIGHRESKEKIENLIDQIRDNPEEYIIQEFEHLSVLENRIVDLRIHAHVDQERIIVSNTPWGRANWTHGNGKVNIGSTGFTSPVIVVNEAVR